MNNPDQPQPSPVSGSKATSNLKAVALDLFKKSQRLPPLSMVTKKCKALALPPQDLELGDFYHL